MKLIVANNPEWNGGGYVVRTDETPVFFQYKKTFKNYTDAEGFAKGVMNYLNNRFSVPLLKGWVLMSTELNYIKDV